MSADSDRPVRGQTLGAEGATALFLVVRVVRPVPMPTLDHEPLVPRRPPWCGEPAAATGTACVAGAWYLDAPTGLLLRCTRAGSGVLRVGDRPLARTRGPRVRARAVLRTSQSAASAPPAS